MSKNLKTSLAKAKGLGSSKGGVHHWWHQRLTSIIMTPLIIWLLFFIKNNNNQDLSTILANIHQPFNIVPILIFIVTAFYHGALGMRVIIEDYIPNVRIRHSLIVFVQLFSIVTVIAMVVALISLTSI